MHCVIFDFDNTLTTFNVSASINRLNGNENVFSNIVCSDDFKRWLTLLRNKNIKLYILSFGYHHVIVSYLKKYNLYYYFDNIFTPSCYGLKDGYSYSEKANGKNKFIEGICKDLKNDNILLIDDDKTNIAWAKEAGYQYIKVNPQLGITNSDFVSMCTITGHWLKK